MKNILGINAKNTIKVKPRGITVSYSDTTGQIVFFKNGQFAGACNAEEALLALQHYWQAKKHGGSNYGKGE